MKAFLLTVEYDLVEAVEAEPQCGEDFCDTCGDCLDCYGDDPCPESGSASHCWYVYSDQVEAFKSRHPEAVAVTRRSNAT